MLCMGQLCKITQLSGIDKKRCQNGSRLIGPKVFKGHAFNRIAVNPSRDWGMICQNQELTTGNITCQKIDHDR